MCTVSYLPTSGGFILTSNRDESPARSPKGISHEERGGHRLALPRDTKGGSWICCSSSDRMVCLLNGAFTKHKHRPPYAKSRGVMVLEFFDYPHAGAFLYNYDFEGMEPFTMVIWDKGQLYELRRTETSTHPKPLDPADCHIWSSSTLYEDSVKRKRKGWFAQWLGGKPAFTQENILDFHRTAGDGDPFNDLIMDRAGIVRTVSITQVIKGGDGFRMEYNDLLNGTHSSTDINIKE